DAIRKLEHRLAIEGIDARRLHTSHAFHSGLMDGAVDAFIDVARTVEIGSPAIPYVSNVTGDWVTKDLVGDPTYWGRHIRKTARFGDGAAQLLQRGETVFLEVGPGNTLSAFLRQQARPQDGHVVLSSMRHPQEDAQDLAVALNALGRMWVSGAAVAWDRFSSGETRRRVPLPSYPFERTRCWVEPDKPKTKRSRSSGAVASQNDVSDWFYTPSWTRTQIPVPNGSAPDGWLVFVDETGFGEQAVERLRSMGKRVATVRAGTKFREDGSSTFE